MDMYSLTAIVAIALGIVGIGVVIRRFVLDRKQQGMSPCELTDEDRAEIAEWRRQLNPLRWLIALLGVMGGFAVLAGIASVVGLDSHGKPDWSGGIDCLVFGGILILPAVLLSKRFK